MDDPDSQPPESVPAEAGPAIPPPIPPVIGDALILPEPVQPQFKLGTTILCTGIIILSMGWMYLSDAIDGRESKLDDPERDLRQVMGRQLDADELAARLPPWRKFVDALQGDQPGDVLKDAISAYQSYTGRIDSPDSTRTLIILLAEAGRRAEAEAKLKTLDSDEQDFAAAIRFAYWESGQGLPVPEFKELLAKIHPRWSQDKLQRRTAERRGDLVTANAARSRIEARARPLQNRMGLLNAASTLWMAVGLAFFLRWGVLRFANRELGNGIVIGPWTGRSGFATLVRGEALGQLVSFLSSALAESVLVLTGVVSLVTALPLLWLGSKYLLTPLGHTLRSCFGLDVPANRWGRVIWIGLALTGIGLLGETAIAALTSSLGIDSPWADFMPEELLWKPWNEATLDTLNTVVWAPICEEIIYRGFLFGTLRRRFSLFPAAVLSSVIFSLGHGYSVEGLLGTAWSGFIWAFSFEKTRSLLPGIVSHSLGNALVTINWIVVFRT